MVKEFDYTTSNGTKSRKVFVVTDKADYIGGYDLNMLSPRSASMLLKANSGFTATANTKSTDLPKHCASWDKAYRNFSKSKIVMD